MRILFVTHNYPRFTGDTAGNFVHRLALALKSFDAHVNVLAPGTPMVTGADLVDGIPVERVVYAAPEQMTLAYSGNMAEAVRESWRGRLAFAGLVRALRSETVRHVQRARREGRPYDAIHAHWWFPAGVSVWSAGVTNALPGRVITMHGSDVRLARTKTFMHPIMRKVLRSATHVTAVSSWLAETANSIVPDVPIGVAPMPVDTTRFVPCNDTIARRSVLFVGRFNAQKGVADLFDAFARIPLHDARIELVGDGPDAGALRMRAESLGIAERITWHGMRPPEDVARLYRECAVVAMPSREEGLGLVAVEALLSGTPVVAYDSGGLRDVVSPEYGGALVTPGNIDELAGALHNTLTTTTASDAARTTGRPAMLQRFDMSAVAERYMALYSESP